jgi:2-amino-4-hydroxy-6-hydroxymethyldihydropteridine diphosphokinase
LREAPVQVFVALGCNLGDREAQLDRAFGRLAREEGVQLVARSAIRQTPALLPPEDPTPQPDFLNAVAQLSVELAAPELLKRLKAIEVELGRRARTRWAPRELDLDLLVYGQKILDLPGITVPHPELHRRRFVLEPLVELAPGFKHPVLGLTFAELLQRLPS